jgi:hypothetical protein
MQYFKKYANHQLIIVCVCYGAVTAGVSSCMRVPLNALVVTLMIYAKKWKAYDVFGLTTVLLFTGAVSSLVFAYSSTTVADTTTATAEDSSTTNGSASTTAAKDSKVISGAQQEFNDKHAHAVALHDKAQATAPAHDATDNSTDKATTTATSTNDSAHEHNE